jgi:hypothetical protein
MILQGQVGSQQVTDGAQVNVRQGKSGDLIASELHGRFYEQTYRGNVYAWGKTLTALSANSITLTATTTPIVGVWNPATSLVNLVILQANVQIVPNNLTSGAGPGGLVWASSTGNAVISTGNSPWNRKTLSQTGSSAKAFDLATALTGLTNNATITEGADFTNLSGLTYTTLGSTAELPSQGGVQNFDGSLIVPPGGVLILVNTVSSTVFSATSRILWEEVPV